MRVLVAGQNYWVQGGADRVMIDHINILNRFGIDSVPFAGHDERNIESEWGAYFPCAANIKSPNVFDVLRYIYSPASKKAISTVLDKYRPDVVHCHIYYGVLTSSIIGEIKKRKIPLVQTLHEFKSVCPVYTAINSGKSCDRCSGFKFYNALINRCNRGSVIRSAVSTVESYVSLFNGSVSSFDKFIAVSDFLRERVIAMGLPQEKVVTIHNPVDTESIVPSYQHEDYYLYYGRVEEDKGIFLLLEAFNQMPNLRLVIVGVGGALDSAKQYVAKNSMNNVKMMGYLSGENLANVIKSAKCTIVPSMCFETFGLTAAESMAYGKPVIASDIGGLPEVVENEVTGLLFQMGDLNELIGAVEYMEDNSDKILAMGQAGRSRVERLFSHKVYFEKVNKIYDDISRKKN